MKDFLIVGRGLAATILMHRMAEHGLSFQVIGHPGLSSSSRVAAGLWNPVVFKRMSPSWMADVLIRELMDFYRQCEKKMKVRLLTPRELIRPFAEEQEEAMWRKKADGDLKNFLDPAIYRDTGALNPFLIQRGYGIVKSAGNLDVASFLDATASYFKDHIDENIFDHSLMKIGNESVTYGPYEARHIVFCEGYLVKDNPWFSWVPLKPAKGEIIDVQCDDIDLGSRIFNRNGFIFRPEPGIFRVGATYQWDELDDQPTAERLSELHTKIRSMLNAPYQVVAQKAGVRPSSHDLRPIVGPHPVHERLSIFNGLGSKGVMLAPYFSKNFVHFYLKKEEIHPDVHLSRYYHLYEHGQKTKTSPDRPPGVH